MKNVYYLFLVLIGLLCSLSTSAKKVLYSQNFETATSVAETGWTSPSAAAGLSIGSDEKGKFLRFVPSGNDRSAHLFWDAALIKNELSADFTSYQITFGFSFNKFGNNHMTSEIAVMSEESIAKKKANANYRTNNNGALFDLTQLSNTGRTASASGDQDFAINGDSTNYKALTAGVYYTVTLNIDTLARTVQYTIKPATSDDPIASDIYTVPEGIDMTATGLYVLGGRYTPDIMFDEIEVSVDKTAANTPTVTLTGINNAQRVYTVKFQEDEILHLDFNGTTKDVNYSDVDNGTYTWSNNPNYDPNNTDKAVTDACESGTLKAWTTLDNLKSDEVVTEVTNNVIALPANPDAAIKAIQAMPRPTTSLATTATHRSHRLSTVPISSPARTVRSQRLKSLRPSPSTSTWIRPVHWRLLPKLSAMVQPTPLSRTMWSMR